jgi:putative Mg2+ transporter-C (MgtC) family protein
MEAGLDLYAEMAMAFRALLAAVLGALIGWERHFRNPVDSEIRTFAAVSLGACTFGLISVHSAGGNFDPTHISAQVVTGMGFIGAGIILKESGRIRGLATAASLWATASVGLALAHGYFGIALVNTTVIFLVRHVPDWRRMDSTYRSGAAERDAAPPSAGG